MRITVKYFGQISEITQKEEEVLEIYETSIAQLLDRIYSKYEKLKNKEFKIAQNRELVDMNTEINGSEIALLPPFAGG
ncbi:MoaD/ThiS family protein [Gaetbulibacter saemankumensis]|uniref:MoaD/ThiS family protein n=1 Tax=Gaetbulibacter saemankumensis TaxID=311208 RepID=UPI00040D4E6C|nr:MoaD/ThiS family protein [Gaetbulibacter saemankumensis]